ncbi:hypothetical protein BC939DRAFT_449312 [Gamsiella multidivaricata]|uniref:uncharacterized protein n=1 Tax=Gamsiella multidivaricata TaxID=101098 RepID=UPI002220AC56|nr:uncharacterized protein BC939DRAFT_449312 [Gamsiella multidivaricata]KAI7824823.1 hypothetical protein BC939DRAFT_449312 [Gamsiella multidivaricata]
MSLQQHTDMYPLSLSDTDWAQILNNNRDAQDLLSTAIAHHDQYREDDPIKRKGIISQLHNKAPNNPSQSDLNERSLADSQQNHSENDHSSDEGHSPGEGKPAPKKAGRKPLTTEPTNKRKAQNRAAQRAFRDRKERYVKSLEERIKELEELNPTKTDSKLAEENMSLKVLVQKLETENYFLKEQAFTFDFPISQPGLYDVSKISRDGLLNSTHNQVNPSPDHSSSSPASQSIDTVSSKSSASPASASTKPFPGSVAKPPTYDQLPWSPPSSVGDSVPNSPLNSDPTTPEQESIHQPTYTDNAGVVPSRFRNSSPEEIALFSSILDGTGNTASVLPSTNPQLQQSTQTKDAFGAFNATGQLGQFTQSGTLSASNASPASTLAGLSEHSPSPTLEDLVNTPLFGVAGNVPFTPTTANMSVPPLTFEQTQALFTDFRDPSDPRDFYTNFEDPIETAFPEDPIGGLFNDQLLDYTSMFANVATTPAREESQKLSDKSQTSAEKHMLPALEENEKAIPCPQAWEHIAKHPNFDDADIDDLCIEMKSKAKCSGHGPVIPVSEVNKLMNRLNQE